jgi:hypothetical protein
MLLCRIYFIPLKRWYQSNGYGSLRLESQVPGVALLPILDLAVLTHGVFKFFRM